MIWRVQPICFLIRFESWLKGATPTSKDKLSARLEAVAVIREGSCNDVGAVGLANVLTGFFRRLVLVTVDSGP